jgi:hypothetical protein
VFYALNNGQYLVVDEGSEEAAGLSSLGRMSSFDSGGFSPDNSTTPRNAQKYAGQAFMLIDTNDAAANDTNLYNACLSFGTDTGTNPILQIERYGTDGVIIKASHFDYSGETDRDFAVLICDQVGTPVWKNVNLVGPDAQDGWLIQGLVANWKVTEATFMLITNLNPAYNAFFRAIPYSGPLINLTGVQPSDVVSNVISITASISDLSGTTNHQFAVTVNGLKARFTIASSNIVNLDTRYAPNGTEEVELYAGNDNANPLNIQNPTPDKKTVFANTATLPLDFSNDTYLVWASDMCSPDVGINHILFAVSKAQNIAATISDPSNGQVLASYSGYVPYPATVDIPWNFTKADGATPYTNDTYSVTFTAYDPATLTITNTIEHAGVRTAGGAIVTYEEEDPKLSAGPYLNSEANKWVSSLAAGYESLYYTDFFSQTLYTTSDIGPDRDNPPGEFPYVLTGSFQLPWAAKVFYAISNDYMSDFNFYMGHGSGIGLGGSGPGSTFVMGWIDTATVYSYVIQYGTPDWRMRKVALWACYTDAATPPVDPHTGLPVDTTAGGTYKDWPTAFGIRKTLLQLSSLMGKNVGLFFGGALPQGGYQGTFGGTQVELAAMFDDLWVTGPNPYPGACDPTYAFSWVLNQIEGISPQVLKGQPAWIGFGYLPYTGIYDGELMTNNVDHISR